MKKVATLLIFIFLTGCVSYATQEDFKQLSAVNEVKLKKEVIYDKVMVYIATKYISPKKVIEYCDKVQGIATFGGAFEWRQPGNFMATFSLHYKITVTIKDNKYKIEMTPLYGIYSYDMSSMTPTKEMIAPYKEEFNNINSALFDFISGKNKADDF